jgi:hypothetical protein
MRELLANGDASHTYRARSRGVIFTRSTPLTAEEMEMSKERQSNREAKKKPARTLAEKRAAKKAKKESRGLSLPPRG